MQADVRDSTSQEARLRKALDGVEGYFSFDEAWALNRAVRESRATGDLRVVEIGSYKGRSTIAICCALQERGSGSCLSIDPHAPTGKESYVREHGTIDTYDEFMANVCKAGIDAYVRPIRSTSADASHAYDGKPIDVLFIDGSHDYDDVVIDIELWTRLLKANSIVAFNDPYAPGVNRAVREYVAATYRSGGFARAYHVNNTLFLVLDQSTNEKASYAALAAYFYVERQSFKLRKLLLKGILESRGVIYRKLG